MTISDLAAEVVNRIVASYPEPIHIHLVLTNDPDYRIVFLMTAQSPEGPYDVTGHLTVEELQTVEPRQAAALVLMRGLLDDDS